MQRNNLAAEKLSCTSLLATDINHIDLELKNAVFFILIVLNTREYE